jgi:hypothetical protein
MKRLMLFVVGLSFLLCAWAFAAEQSATKAPVPEAPAKTVKVTRMRAPGTILDVSDVALKIERKVKDKVEPMTFILEKPTKFRVGDKVRVTYVENDGKMVATRVVKAADIKARKPAKQSKEVQPAGRKAPLPVTAPAVK